MAVNHLQLIVVVRIRILVRRILVVHAARQGIIIEVLVLVAKADVVAQFLAGDTLLPVIGVVVRPREIGVVELGVPGRDVAGRIDRDPGNAEPAVLPIVEVADPDLAGRPLATPPYLPRIAAVHFDHVEDARVTPVVKIS